MFLESGVYFNIEIFKNQIIYFNYKPSVINPDNIEVDVRTIDNMYHSFEFTKAEFNFLKRSLTKDIILNE